MHIRSCQCLALTKQTNKQPGCPSSQPHVDKNGKYSKQHSTCTAAVRFVEMRHQNPQSCGTALMAKQAAAISTSSSTCYCTTCMSTWQDILPELAAKLAPTGMAGRYHWIGTQTSHNGMTQRKLDSIGCRHLMCTSMTIRSYVLTLVAAVYLARAQCKMQFSKNADSLKQIQAAASSCEQLTFICFLTSAAVMDQISMSLQ